MWNLWNNIYKNMKHGFEKCSWYKCVNKLYNYKTVINGVFKQWGLFFVLSLLKKRKRKEILGPSNPEIPLIIKEQRDNRGQSVAQWDVLLVILEQHIKKKTTSFCARIYMVLCAARRSGWTWQSPFWILASVWTVALNCQNTSENACYGYEKCRKSNPIRIFLWRMKVLEAVCKR